MGRNKSGDAIAARRRELVGQLLCRRMTRREVVEALAAANEKNPATEQPWDLATIQRDAAALERQWKTASLKKAVVWKARQLAEIEEVKREAWARGKLDFVLRAIELEAKITGTQAPVKLTGEDGKPLAWPVVLYLPENGRQDRMPLLVSKTGGNSETIDSDDGMLDESTP